MHDPSTPPGPADDPESPPELMPWDLDPPPPDPDAPRERIDAFNGRRRNQFLKALTKTGCISDAARQARIAARTVQAHMNKDPEFARMVELAFEMCELPVELTAWERAVKGVEEEVVVGGKVRTRIRYSEGLLRLLLRGSNPDKYGSQPSRRRLRAWERQEIEREVEEKWRKINSVSFDDALEDLSRRLEKMDQSMHPLGADEIAAGWTRTPEGYMVPPGYGPLAPPAPGDPEREPGSGDPRL